MEKQAFEPAIVYNLKKSIDIAAGAVVSKQFIKTKGGNITFFAFGKGQGLSEHTAPFDAVVQVVEGKAEVSIGGKLTRSRRRRNDPDACQYSSCPPRRGSIQDVSDYDQGSIKKLYSLTPEGIS
ncbi:MAG: cupin domain-containing protein [Cyclobacteriaceae bacterium]|nr:cupin domain-containing protein [Cyclobacteriaceae bacterium]